MLSFFLFPCVLRSKICFFFTPCELIVSWRYPNSDACVQLEVSGLNLSDYGKGGPVQEIGLMEPHLQRYQI